MIDALLEKIVDAKVELGDSVNSAALCYINLADPMLDENTKTIRLDASTTGKMLLRVNPDWLDKISKMDLTLILNMEAARIALQHITIRDTHNVSNLYASDHIAYKFSNGSLRLDGTSVTEAMDRSGVDNLYIQAISLYEKDTQQKWNPDDETLERLGYWMQKVIDSDESCIGQSDSHGEGDAFAKGQSPEQSALNDYFCDTTRHQDWRKNDEMEETVRELTKSLDDSGALGSSTWGTGHGNMLLRILAANKKINNRKILNLFLDNILSQNTESTRMKVNRRYGIAFPGHKSVYTERILLAGDTSGSMSYDDMSDAATLLFSLAREVEIYFSWWDSECTLPVRLKKKDKIGNGIDVVGRGGTDVQCVFDMLKSMKKLNEFSGIIIFSDMIFPEPEIPKCISQSKILWIPTVDGAVPPSWVKKNRVLPISTLKECIRNMKHL